MRACWPGRDENIFGISARQDRLRAARPAQPAKIVHPAEFVDDDDTTVQLLADAEEGLPDGGEVTFPEGAVHGGPMESEDCYPAFPDGMPVEGEDVCEPMVWAPLRWG
jgi:hypothetical protein